MLDRHYAPRGELRLFTLGGVLDVRPDRTTGALLLGAQLSVQHAVCMPTDPAGYAQRLYAELHRLDDLGCDLIMAERVPETPDWAGVRDRLARAAQQP